MTDQIIARLPPSPTGWFHIGNARTALFNYFFVKKSGGKLLFRLEDTDRERSRDDYSQDIIDGLKWLGLDIDFNSVYKQSEHSETYKKYLSRLIEEGRAYISKEEPKEEGQRAEVIRLKNPGKVVTFQDMIRGDVTVDTTELGDFVIAKSIDEPIYHLAVVVDDYEMGVTHVLRGEDGIYNTPRQILIQEAIGAPRPIYAHLPFILNEDRSKLSKRKQGELVSLKYYRENGYLPEALVNFLALTGWNPGGNDEELLTIEQIIEKFDIHKVQKGGAVFNKQKLLWTNKEYIKKLPRKSLFEKVKQRLPEEITNSHHYSDARLDKILEIITERIHTFGEITQMAEAGEIGYFFDAPEYDKTLLKSTEFLPETIKLVETLHEDNFTLETVKAAVWDYATEKGRGQVLWPMRVALTGKEKSPDPFTVASILGKEETLLRLNNALS
ncbi:MAG: glutamate--tRNA ligase family protein [bacterium]